MTGKYKESERDGDMAKMENITRKKVLSLEEEALRARPWTVNSMNGAVIRAKELFLRYGMTLLDLFLFCVHLVGLPHLLTQHSFISITRRNVTLLPPPFFPASVRPSLLSLLPFFRFFLLELRYSLVLLEYPFLQRY